MKPLFVIGFTIIATIVLNPGSTHADTSACIPFNDHQKMTLKGTIVLTALGRDDDSGKLDPSMAIALDSPVCYATDPSSKSDFITIYSSEADSKNGNSASVSLYRKWIGRQVTITGKMEGAEEGASDLSLCVRC